MKVHELPNGSPVTLPDGRSGRWYRVGREEPRAMRPGMDWPPTGGRQDDCGRMRPKAPRLDQLDDDGGRW